MAIRLGLVSGIALGLLLALAQAQAADADRGQLLYENHCTTCHASTVHVRSKHKARTVEEIGAQVRRWSEELGLTWTEEDVAVVRRFLNARYYGYKEK